MGLTLFLVPFLEIKLQKACEEFDFIFVLLGFDGKE